MSVRVGLNFFRVQETAQLRVMVQHEETEEVVWTTVSDTVAGELFKKLIPENRVHLSTEMYLAHFGM
jgi:hypothetical protein